MLIYVFIFLKEGNAITSKSAKDKIWYLKEINLLSRLSDEEIKYIDSRSRMRTYKKGSTIYFSSSDVQQIFFLKQGKVKLFKTDPSGKELVYAVLKDKESFGSLSPINGAASNEIAQAMEDTMCCVIDKKVFSSFIKDKPSIVLRLNKMLGLKIHELEMLVEQLTFKTVMERMVYLLLKLNKKFGVHFNGGWMINISLTHNDIASMIGSTRESTTLALNKLKSLGLIDSRKKKIILPDLEKLSNFSEPQ